MELQEVKDKFESDEGFRSELLKHIVSTDQGKTVINNHVKVEVDEKIGGKVKETYTRLDEIAKEVTGNDKPNGTKTTDFVKSLLEKGEEIQTKFIDLETKYSELEKTAAKGGDNDLYKEKFETFQGTHKTMMEERDTKIQDLEKSISRNSVTSSIQSQLSGIKFNESLPDGLVKEHIKTRIDSLVGRSEMQDDILIHHDGQGKIRQDSMGNLMSTSDVLKDELSSIIASEGMGGGGGESIKSKTKGLAVDISSATTKTQFTEMLITQLLAQGVARNSQEWGEKMSESFKAHSAKLEKLPY